MRAPAASTRRGAPTRALASVAAALLALGAAGCASIGKPDGAPDAGYEAGDGSFATWSAEQRGDPVVLTGETFDGETVTLSDWAGDVVVMNFWFAACPPCRVEAPDLVALHEDYPEIHLLGVNPRDDAGAAQAFERTFEIPYPSFEDRDGGVLLDLSKHVPPQAVPTTLVLDSQGRVAARIHGIADPSILRTILDEAVSA